MVWRDVNGDDEVRKLPGARATGPHQFFGANWWMAPWGEIPSLAGARYGVTIKVPRAGMERVS